MLSISSGPILTSLSGETFEKSKITNVWFWDNCISVLTKSYSSFLYGKNDYLKGAWTLSSLTLGKSFLKS